MQKLLTVLSSIALMSSSVMAREVPKPAIEEISGDYELRLRTLGIKNDLEDMLEIPIAARHDLTKDAQTRLNSLHERIMENIEEERRLELQLRRLDEHRRNVEAIMKLR